MQNFYVDLILRYEAFVLCTVKLTEYKSATLGESMS